MPIRDFTLCSEADAERERKPKIGALVTVDFRQLDTVILQVWTEGGIANVHMTSEEARRLARRLIGTADTVEPASGNDPIGSVFVVGDMRQPKAGDWRSLPSQPYDPTAGLVKALDEA